MAAILLIGAIGYLLDKALRSLQWGDRHPLH